MHWLPSWFRRPRAAARTSPAISSFPAVSSTVPARTVAARTAVPRPAAAFSRRTALATLLLLLFWHV